MRLHRQKTNFLVNYIHQNPEVQQSVYQLRDHSVKIIVNTLFPPSDFSVLAPQSCFPPVSHPTSVISLLLHKLWQLAQIFPRQRPQAADTVIFKCPAIFCALTKILPSERLLAPPRRTTAWNSKLVGNRFADPLPRLPYEGINMSFTCE